MSLLVTSAPPRLAGPTVDPTIDVCGCEDLGSSLARDHSQLIHVAQRGWVDSDPELTCPEMSTVQRSALEARALDANEIARGTDAMRGCRARLVAAGIDPAQYNYDTAAHDLLDLMYALHIRRANFIAFEEADAEVFAVLRQAPAAVRSITLDNPPPPGTTLMSHPISDLAGAWSRYVAVCDADPICGHAYPNLARSAQTGAREFDAHPPLVTTPNPFGPNLPPVRVLLDSPRSAEALATALGDPSTYPVIPAAIEPADEAAAEAIIASSVVGVAYPPPDAPWGAAASYGCAYDINTQDLEGEALAAAHAPAVRGAATRSGPRGARRGRCPTCRQPCRNRSSATCRRCSSVATSHPTATPPGSLPSRAGWRTCRASCSRPSAPTFLPTARRVSSALRRQFLEDPAAKLDTNACEQKSPKIQFVAPAK